MRSSKVAIIASGLLSLLALATGGVGTYAWFVQNKKADTTYGGIVANGDGDIHMSYNYYLVDHVDSEGGLFFSETPAAPEDVKMGEYSVTGSKYQLLLEVDYSMAIERDRSVFVTTRTTEYIGAGEAPTSSTLNALSSVVEFWITGADSIDQGGYFYVPPENGRTGYTSSSFVVRSADGVNMEWDASTIGDDGSRLQAYSAAAGTRRAWILFDYNAESIEYLSYKFLGNFYMSQGLTFTCDFKFEV